MTDQNKIKFVLSKDTKSNICMYMMHYEETVWYFLYSKYDSDSTTKTNKYH